MSNTKSRKFSLPTFKSRINKQEVEEFLMPATSNDTSQQKSPAIPISPSLGNLQKKQQKNTTTFNRSTEASSSSATGDDKVSNGKRSPASSSDGSAELLKAGYLLVPDQVGEGGSSVLVRSSSNPTSPRMLSNKRISKTPPTMSPPSSPRSSFFQWFGGRGKTVESPEIKENDLKIALFGCEGSGKSTLFKQCEKIFGGNYSEKAVFHSATFIQHNLVEVLRTLFEGILKEQQLNGDLDFGLNWATSQKMKNFISKHASEKLIGDKVLDSSIWYEILQDSRVKGILDNIHEYKYLNYSIGNCIEYYVEEYQRLTCPQYRATEKDYITFQQRTTGVISRSYSHKDKSITLMDVGGVRTERKKWSAVMKCCQALVYVVSLSEFDEVCWEDITTNRFIEDLSTFKDWIKNESIKNQPVFLVFTNMDRFNKKLSSPTKLSILNSLLSIDSRNDNLDSKFYLNCFTNKFKEADQYNKVCDIIVTNSLDIDDLGPKISQVFDEVVERYNVNK